MKDLLILAAIALLALAGPAYSGPRLPAEYGYRSNGTDWSTPPYIRVNIIGPTDERGPITVKGPEAGLTAEEIQHIRATTGFVRCPGTKYGNGLTGSGALIIANDQIISIPPGAAALRGSMSGEDIGVCLVIRLCPMSRR